MQRLARVDAKELCDRVSPVRPLFPIFIIPSVPLDAVFRCPVPQSSICLDTVFTPLYTGDA